jgi:glutathione S-transferase
VLLIGMFDSPFVRRVAVSMQLLQIDYEHADWSVGRDFDRIRAYNPLGRVPTLVLDDGEVLCESAAILDYLDERVGTARALLPAGGPERRQALRLMALAIGAAEKGREQIYEHAFRPADKRHEPWLQRCRAQMHGALAEIERYCERGSADSWLIGSALSQADITVSCAFTFLRESLRPADLSTPYRQLAALTNRCEAMPAFKSTHRPFFNPGAVAIDRPG